MVATISPFMRRRWFVGCRIQGARYRVQAIQSTVWGF